MSKISECQIPNWGITEMGIRRHAREIAVQALYMSEFHSDKILLDIKTEQNISLMLASFDFSPACIPFAELLTRGTLQHIDFIDRWLSRISENWTLPRMARVDRALLRVSTFELAFISEIPIRVTINEAIEVSKRFCSDDSPMFINGILDRMASLPEVRAIREANGGDNVTTLFGSGSDETQLETVSNTVNYEFKEISPKKVASATE
ncbi:MAG TPA: transcription antitermination factor NusB [Oligoflexia bacterium]|nr:transcription antitermination factor NusB [Oligoflexia bacterium]HMP48414.1 transcription antitermination factor NusB [Oligoflexia bacterium]